MSVSATSLAQRLRLAFDEARESSRPLPPEPLLASSLGVSRSALREALARLEGEGLIARKSRAGTVVNGAALDIQTWLTRQEPFVQTLANVGLEDASIEVLALRFRRMTAEEATYFGQAAGCGVVDVRKRWRAGGVVHMAATYQVPAPSARGLSDIANPSGPVFTLAARLLGSETAWEVAHSKAELATGSQAEDLEVEPGSAVFVLDLMGVSSAGTRLYRTVERHVGNVIDYGFVRTFK